MSIQRHNIQQQSINTSFPFCSVLTIIFVIAKLLHCITWSWWVVFLPTIIPFALFFIVVGFVLVFGLLAAIVG